MSGEGIEKGLAQFLVFSEGAKPLLYIKLYLNEYYARSRGPFIQAYYECSSILKTKCLEADANQSYPLYRKRRGWKDKVLLPRLRLRVQS